MFGSNTYLIRTATEIDGTPKAAPSPADGRNPANPFKATSQLAVLLRLRAGALKARDRKPSLDARMRDAVVVHWIQRPLA